ncbi:MAG: endopeptidase La [Bacteroidales bacterium]|nr:endopeptidase La [Bacteroidales bacterium]
MKKKPEQDEIATAGITGRAEFIPLISKDEEDFLLREQDVPDRLPVLTIRDNVLFPGVIMPIAANRPKSVKLLKEAGRKSLRIGVLAQLGDDDDPSLDQVYHVGVVARVLKVFDLPDGTTMAVVQGSERFGLTQLYISSPYNYADIVLLPELPNKRKRAFRTNMTVLRNQYTALLQARNQGGPVDSIKDIGSDKILINFIATHLDISTEDKQNLLCTDTYEERLEMLLVQLEKELQYTKVRDDILDKTRNEMDRQQREYYLNQQMRVIQDELGGSPTDHDVEELQARAAKKHWNKKVSSAFDHELDKLKRMQLQSPDYSTQISYLDFMLDLPWDDVSRDDLRVDHARRVLDRDHYGIEKVKDRIIEHLAVLSLKGDLKAPILCLVGPPGTGKTSLGKSIAAAMNRKYVRMALGGMHDESEIRGHRRTYIGAMPGRVLQNIKKAGTSNPVFVLDEIDKVQGQTVNGDPTSALLEVLDPEQNVAFHDNYLDVDYDLSHVMFIATANTLSTIQPALLDRMEVIDLSGYILEEKIEIASRHLVPRAMKEHGFTPSALKFSKEILTLIINDYTRESGVRGLDKALTKIIRRRAVRVASGETFGRGAARNITADEVREALGLPIHNSERRAQEPSVGVVTGLAWTQVGGEILFIEASTSHGKGTLSMTGNLGDVMKESATLAFEYLKANAEKFGIATDLIENSNIHIHVPEGATPKDGPSAGITMFVAMVSAFTGRKVRPETAMTGEITLRGAVTPVGGIKEKILAAKRAGITNIILSEDNRRDIEDIKAEYLAGLEFHYITNMSQALSLALLP